MKDMQEQADIDGALVDYKEKGHTVELIGKEELESSPVYKLKPTLKTATCDMSTSMQKPISI
ncbi:MAG TPA: hypothetical protein VNN73_03785 [Blastocatellia bacterium]|nr:hypothetical protein [Blastocatellia bacterium]